MTIQVELPKVTYLGPIAIDDRVELPFTYSEPEHIIAYKNSTMLEYNTAYRVQGANVILLEEFGAEDKLTITRKTPLDNQAFFPQESRFDSEKVNDSLDKIQRQQQEQEEEISRCLKYPVTGGSTEGVIFPYPDPRKFIMWANDGTLTNSPITYDEMMNRCETSANNAKASELRAKEYADLSQDAWNKIRAQDIKYLTAGDYMDITYDYKLNVKANDMIQGFSKSQWDSLPDSTKASILLAVVYED